MNLKPLELINFNANRRLNLIYYLLKFPRFVNAMLFIMRPLYESKQTFLNRTFRFGAQTIGMGHTGAEELGAYRYGIKAIVENFRRTLKAAKSGEPIVWVEWVLNAELIEAFGIHSFNPEIMNIFGNTRGAEYPPMLIEAAEDQGTPIENCSAQKMAVGSFVTEQIPAPDFILGATHPCDTSISIYQTLEYLTEAKSFIFDCPYWRDDESYKYYEKTVWQAIKALEEHYDRKIDWDRLKTQLERTNKVNFYVQEICEMNRAVPCPGSLIDLNFLWVVREVNIRSDDIVRLAEGLYHAVKKRFDAGKGVVKDEKLRVVLWFPPMGFFTYLFKWMEEEFGAVIVADFIGHVSTHHIDTSSEESMVEGMAKTQLHLAMARQCHGPIELFTEDLHAFIRDYSPDCMIFSGHNGCKHGWAVVKIVQDICRKNDIPTLYLSVDIMDQRHTTETEIRNEIREFLRSNALI